MLILGLPGCDYWNTAKSEVRAQLFRITINDLDDGIKFNILKLIDDKKKATCNCGL